MQIFVGVMAGSKMALGSTITSGDGLQAVVSTTWAHNPTNTNFQ